MSQELLILSATAASIGLFHTLFGPDHYIPFIAMSKARKWSMLKTTWITLLCGIGHILSSVLLGVIGVALGIAVTKLEWVESLRGDIAAWALIGFGFAYFAWGLNRAFKNKQHEHIHFHAGGEHDHLHTHNREHAHVHDMEGAENITPWVLFTIFVFGPCEPLIPLLMYPAAKSSFFGVILVTSVFGAVTIASMLTIVLTASFEINRLPVERLERYTHALAGAAILACGLAIKFLGL